MYLIKNAVKSIVRAKGRNILIFILVLFVAVSACIALSVKNSAESAKQVALNALNITAQISVDRGKVMGGNTMDKLEMAGVMSQSLSLDELKKYAESEYADDFYYTVSTGFDAAEDFEIYEADTSSSMWPDRKNRSNGDITAVGYSSHDAMTSFISGENSIYDGAVFDQNSDNKTCVISYELASLNNLSVGDTIQLINPEDDQQTYSFTICGLFKNESTDSYANQIFTSFDSLYAVISDAQDNAETVTNKDGSETTTALHSSVNGTYVFTSLENYEAFCQDVEKMGLDTEVYTVTSSDISRYEQSIVPLESLSKFTMVFFLVVLIIGGGILVVFNIFCVRERKYEIGVLAAIGMKKGKVTLQFLCEAFIVTFIAIFVGIGIGTVASEPVANALLQDQIASVESASELKEKNFGGKFHAGANTDTAEIDYVDTIDTSTDITVLVSLMGIALLLTVVASSAGMISVLRYNPLKILSDRT
ncbi:MAG: ABC transporter permease [Acutalibacteraceae bacterium]